MKHPVRPHVAWLLVTTGLVLAAGACKSGDNSKPAAGSAEIKTASAPPAPAAPAPAPPAPAPPPAGSATGSVAAAPTDTTSIVPNAKLDAIELPVPKVGPAKGEWKEGYENTDGIRDMDFVEANAKKDQEFWYDLSITDCNLPKVKKSEHTPDKPYAECFEAAPAKLKDFPMFNTRDHTRTLKVGHLSVTLAANASHSDKVTDADLEDYLGRLDLAGWSKL